MLSKSQLATEVFPLIAETVADGMAWVQVHAAPGTDTSRRLSEPASGASFLQQLDQLKEGTITNLIVRLEQSALERTPQLKGGIGEKLLHQFVSGLGRLLVERKVASELENWGADRVYRTLRESLKREAAVTGHKETIARREISELIIRKGIVPGIMTPIRSTARTHQMGLIAIACALLVAPPACVRGGRALLNRRRKKESQSGAPPVIN